MEFIYPVFTRMPGGVTVDDSGLSCCMPCLSNTNISLCLVFLLYFENVRSSCYDGANDIPQKYGKGGGRG